MQLTGSKSCPAWALARAILTVAFFFLLLHVHLDAPAGKVNLIPVAKIKQLPRYDASGQSPAALASSATSWIPAPHASILTLDYKQNLLVWPVLACGFIRSPPLA